MPDLLQPYMTIMIIAAIALGVLLCAVILYKLLSGTVRGRKGSRLGISEYYEIDKSRRLVLLRRDDTEHLVLIGGEHDLVIESGIGSPLMAAEPMQPAMRQAPRPPVFGSRRPPLRTVENTIDMNDQDPRN